MKLEECKVEVIEWSIESKFKAQKTICSLSMPTTTNHRVMTWDSPMLGNLVQFVASGVKRNKKINEGNNF